MANIDPGDTTMHACKTLVATLLLAGMACAPPAVRAAQSYDNCTGFIESLPTTISTSGVWCLHHDLATSISTGNAIEIATNNVTIDCNDFKLGGLAAGNGSQANGISANNRQNTTIRHCNIRGFLYGIRLNSGAGHLVEDNRLDNNLYIGIYVTGENSTIRRNRVYDTGGFTNGNGSFGIYAAANIVDNAVSGVFVAVAGGSVEGITVTGSANEVTGNFITGLDLTAADNGAVAGYGIDDTAQPSTLANNRIYGPGTRGIWGFDTNVSFCTGNTIIGFTTAMTDCTDDGGNGLH